MYTRKEVRLLLSNSEVSNRHILHAIKISYLSASTGSPTSICTSNLEYGLNSQHEMPVQTNDCMPLEAPPTKAKLLQRLLESKNNHKESIITNLHKHNLNCLHMKGAM